MRIVVTGATGFVGTSLVRWLTEQGHDVVAAVRDRRKAASTLAEGVAIVEAAISDAPGLEKAMQGADGLVHLAALFNAPDASWDDYRRVNVDGTRRVIQIAADAGVRRIVHCSTVGVAATGTPPFSEESPYSYPRSDKYESTKAEAEQEALRQARERGAPVVVVRPAQVYGPGDLSKLKFYRMVRKGVVVDPRGTSKHPIYVDDLCRAFGRALEASGVEGEVFIAGNPSAVALEKMIQIAAELLNVSYPRVVLPRAAMNLVCAAAELGFGAIGRKAPIHRRSMDFFTKSVEFDVSKAERMLDFHADVPLRSGMQQTVTWYREQGLL